MRALLFGLLVVAMVVAGCGDDDDATAPTTASSGSDEVDAVEAASLVLVFDGEDCTYDGPTKLEAGPAEFVFVNESDAAAAANMVSIDEGYTVQDVIDDLGPEPSEGHHPPWTREVVGVWRTTQSAESHQWEWEIEAGLYAMVCARTSPVGVWFGGGLTVED